MNKKQTLIFFSIMALFNLAANYVHPVTPTYFKVLNLDNSMFGSAFAAMALGMFLLSPFWGKINDLINSKTTILISSIGYALSQIIFATAINSDMIIVSRILAGLTCGGAYVSFLTYTINMSKEADKARNLTINATLQSVAAAFGYFIGGMLGEVNIYLAMYLQIIQLGLSGILFYLFLKPDNFSNHKKSIKVILKESNPLRAFKQCGTFMTISFACLFLVSTLSFLGYTAFDQCFNYYLKDIFLLSSGYNGIIKAAIGLISLIANMTVCIYLMKHTDINKSTIIVLLLCSLLMFGAIQVNQLSIYIIINVLYFGVYAISVPLIQDVIARSGDASISNLVMGFYQATKSLGLIIGAYLAGLLYTYNPKYPFVLGTISFLIASVFAYIYYHKTKEKLR